MKYQISSLVFVILSACVNVYAQDDQNDGKDHVSTLFRGGHFTSGGYGALTNKFTTINGEFANLAGVYGGWYINHSFMIGGSAAALTNNIRVPLQDSTDPTRNLSYMYGQVGAVTEYVIASNRTFHVAFNLFAGAGFTIQYQRYNWEKDGHDYEWDGEEDRNWFTVAEPGVMMEVNVFKWMRFSPGVSYRATFGSDGRGLSDSDLSNISYNATLKFGRF
ncbi:MAG: hypothetical protein ABI477_12270 [Chryseolinea sp.]